MWRGISLGFLFISMTVASLGGLKPSEMGEGSGFVNLTRQLGGSVEIAAFSTLLTRREDFHRAMLSDHITRSSSQVQSWLSGTTASLQSHGYGAVEATAGAMRLRQSTIERQAAILSFND